MIDVRNVSIRDVGDIRRAAESLRAQAEELGDLRVAAHPNIASTRPMVDADGALLATTVFGWTVEDGKWWTNPRLALDSPLPRACRYESQPFWINAHGIWGRRNSAYLDEVNLDYIGRNWDTTAAIVVPVHLPFAQIGAVAFACMRGERSDLSEEFNALWPVLQLLASIFIADYTKVQPSRNSLPANCSLTEREVACLRWAASGKTDDEIATIMGRSRPTIRFHLHNAAEKLNAHNRPQTVAKAGMLGFLNLTN